MTAYSLLDLVPITQSGSGAQPLAHAASVVIAHVGAATSTIRVGAGGIMLPNHAPLVLAE